MSTPFGQTPSDSVPPRVRLSPTGSDETVLDGGWWPRSADVYSELPGLILAIDHVRGPVRRVLLSADGWADHPRHVRVGGRTIRLSFYASQPASLLTATCDGGERVDLLIVDPGEQTETAEAAMAMAATANNVVSAQDIADVVSIAVSDDRKSPGQ